MKDYIRESWKWKTQSESLENERRNQILEMKHFWFGMTSINIKEIEVANH